MYVLVKDLSPKLRAALKDIEYGAHDIQVVAIGEPVNMNVSGGGGRRGFAMLYSLVTDTYELHTGSWGGSNMFVATVVDDERGMAVLPPHGLLIKGTRGHPRTFATIYAHPQAMGKLLPAGVADQKTLSELEQWLVNIHCAYTSSFRKELIARKTHNNGAIRLELQEALDSLVERGYLKRNKAGSVQVTTKGKNARKGNV